MISLERRNILNLNCLSGDFNDRLLSLKQHTILYEQGANFNYIEALCGAVDASIRNYSSVYLTNSKLDTDIFNIADKRLNVPVIYTPICFNTDTDEFGCLYMHFDSVNTTLSIPLSDGGCSFSLKFMQDIVDFKQCIFEFELVTDKLCRIKHLYNDKSYLLNYAPTTENITMSTGGGDVVTNFYFLTSDETYYNAVSTAIDNPTSYEDNSYVFRYLLNNNSLYLYKTTSGASPTPYKTSGGIITLPIGDYYTYNITLKPVSASPTTNESTITYSLCNTLNIKNTLIDPVLKLNTSWVSYQSRFINSGIINELNSLFDIPTNNILHFEYNNIGNKLDFNVLKLKNILSDKNYTKQQSNMFTNVRPTIEDLSTVTIDDDPETIGVKLLYTENNTKKIGIPTNYGARAIETEETGPIYIRVN